MAAPFITLDRTNTTVATHVPRALDLQVRTARLILDLQQIIAEMFQMFDGDGSQDAHYTLVTTKFGLESNAKAHILFDLLNGELAALKGTGQNANAVDVADRLG